METGTTAQATTLPPSPRGREEQRLLAIGLRLLAMLFLSSMFAGVKLAERWGVNMVEALFYRQLVALPLVFAWVASTQGMGAIRTRRIGVHCSRTALGLIGMVFNFGAVILLPLAEATSIGFTMPIFGTILSALLLKEKTGIHRWGAVLLGFAGVLIIVQPSGTHFPLMGALVALTAAILTALISILLRDLGRTEDAGTTVFWFSLLSLPPLLLLIPFFAQSHDAATWALLVAIGLTGGTAQLCMTGALRWAPVSVVLPMDYSSILWATLFGWLLWGYWPVPITWVGAAFIIASGLYIAWREHVRARR